MKKVIILAAIHGDEVYGIELFSAFIAKYQELKLQVKLVIGNKKAFDQQTRFIDTDMNRAYGLGNPGHEGLEIKRIEKEILSFEPDYIIDIHTTRRDSGIFFITDSLEDAKKSICDSLGADILVMSHGYVTNSFVGTHKKAVSLEYSLSAINQETTKDFVEALKELILGQLRTIKTQRNVFEFIKPIPKPDWEKYSGLRSYDEKSEGLALMVPKDPSEMDADYYGFWCKLIQ